MGFASCVILFLSIKPLLLRSVFGLGDINLLRWPLWSDLGVGGLSLSWSGEVQPGRGRYMKEKEGQK